MELNFKHIITESENKALNMYINMKLSHKRKGLITRSEAHYMIVNFLYHNFTEKQVCEIFTNSYDAILNQLDYKEVI